MLELQKTILDSKQTSSVRVDFEKSEFDDLIYNKGRRVLFEKTLQCPCKSESFNQQSNCKNCGGTGWIFIDPIETRMILHSIGNVNQFKDWSEENRGFVNITALEQDELGWMDRITLLDARAYMGEVLHFKKKNNLMFAFTTFPIKQLRYIGLYIDPHQPLVQLKEDVDYTYQGQIIRLAEKYYQDIDVSVTVRYVHSPVFYIMDLKRETMDSFVLDGSKEDLKRFPISAVGRRAQYVLDPRDLNGEGVIKNSYNDNDGCNNYKSRRCESSEDLTNIISGKMYEVTFNNVSYVNVTHNLGYHPFVKIEDNSGEEVDGRIKHLSRKEMLVSFNYECSGKIIFY